MCYSTCTCSSLSLCLVAYLNFECVDSFCRSSTASCALVYVSVPLVPLMLDTVCPSELLFLYLINDFSFHFLDLNCPLEFASFCQKLHRQELDVIMYLACFSSLLVSCSMPSKHRFPRFLRVEKTSPRLYHSYFGEFEVFKASFPVISAPKRRHFFTVLPRVESRQNAN